MDGRKKKEEERRKKEGLFLKLAMPHAFRPNYHIMSDGLTIISRSGRVFQMGDCGQVLLVRGAPTKIAIARPDMILSFFSAYLLNP